MEDIYKNFKWTACEERLPEPGQKVLYYFDMIGVASGTFIEGTRQSNALFASGRGFLRGDVTHWAPDDFALAWNKENKRKPYIKHPSEE